MLAGALKMAPALGAVSVIVGGVLTCASHVAVICEGRPVRLRLSVARALKSYVSATRSLTLALYGAVVSASNNVVPLKNSTLLMLPSGSLAVADSVQLHHSEI